LKRLFKTAVALVLIAAGILFLIWLYLHVRSGSL
jgi:hypothetical protein